MHNTTSPSRFVIALNVEKCTLQKSCVEVCPVSALSIEKDHLKIDQNKCLGCGLCVPSCSENALHLEIRENPQKIFKDNSALYRNIYAEAAAGLIGRKLGIRK
jgi:Fe-S-cluster-containing hydrogenase component 2